MHALLLYFNQHHTNIKTANTTTTTTSKYPTRQPINAMLRRVVLCPLIVEHYNSELEISPSPLVPLRLSVIHPSISPPLQHHTHRLKHHLGSFRSRPTIERIFNIYPSCGNDIGGSLGRLSLSMNATSKNSAVVDLEPLKWVFFFFFFILLRRADHRAPGPLRTLAFLR